MGVVRDGIDQAVLNGLQTEIDVYLAPGQVVHVHWMQGTEEAKDELIYHGLTEMLRHRAQRQDEFLERAREKRERQETDKFVRESNREAMKEYALDVNIQSALTPEEADRYREVMWDNDRLRSENALLVENLSNRGLLP